MDDWASVALSSARGHLGYPTAGLVRDEIDRIERRRSADEQAVALGAAEGDVGDHLRDEDLADQRAVGVVAVDALAGARPDAALPVDAEAVEEAGGRFGEDLAALQALAVGGDGEAADVARAVLDVGGAGVGDVEEFLVGREGEAVRPHHVADDAVDRAALRVDAVDVAAVDLLRRAVALVVGVDAVGRIGEPDRIVGLHHRVVRRVEALALPLVGEHGDRAVMLGARDAPGQVLAGDEPALVVDRVAVGIVGALAEDGDHRRRARRSASCGCSGCPTRSGSGRPRTRPGPPPSARRSTGARPAHGRRSRP